MEESLQGDITEALFEAATELNAEWLWCIVHSPDNDHEGETWKRQRVWQMDQALAILQRQKPGWQEDTSVFAYYVLKAALAMEMENFLVGWLSNSIDTEKWCEYWRAHQKAFYHMALRDKRLLDKNISTRMTDPSLERHDQ